MQIYGFRMNYGSFVRICFMDKRLKIGLLCMLAAVILMPAAFLFKKEQATLGVWVLILTMLLELIGLIFVILSILKKRRG